MNAPKRVPCKVDSAPHCYGYLAQRPSADAPTQTDGEHRAEDYFASIAARYPALRWAGIITDTPEFCFRPLLKRPGGARLDKLLRPGDHVVFPLLACAAASIKDSRRLVERWRARGIVIHFADLQIDLAAELGQYFMTALEMAFTMNRAEAVERNSLQAARLKLEGRPCNGKAPLGTKWVGEGSQRHLVWDHEQRRIMKEIVRLRDGRGLSWDLISDAIEARLAAEEGREPTPRWKRRLWGKSRCARAYRAELRHQELEAAHRNESTGHDDIGCTPLTAVLGTQRPTSLAEMPEDP